jgi:6-phosphogluconate dehydrogenase
MSSVIGVYGLGVMGESLALNIASHNFPVSVFNRTTSKVTDAMNRAKAEGIDAHVHPFYDLHEFIASLQKPRRIIIMVKAGAPVDETITHFLPLLDSGDILIDAGNEWFLNSQARQERVKEKGLLYVAMGVSGGEEGARYGPSMMPGGPKEAYDLLAPVLTKIAAQVDDGPCVTYIGSGASGNYVKMVHNGIEYGDMELIAEAYDILKTLGGLTNEELSKTFEEWNTTELRSFLIEITAHIFKKKDDKGKDAYLVDMILDKAGSKGTGKMTIQEAAERAVPAPTISSALDARYLSAMKDERVAASKLFPAGNSVSLSASGMFIRLV